MILSSMLVLLAAGAVCTSAWGARASVVEETFMPPGGETQGDLWSVKRPSLIAGPGETNRVRIAPGLTDRTVLIEDLGAVLTTAEGCVAVDAHHARCENVAREGVNVDAGDLDDVVVASPGIAIYATGGPAIDHLTGADRSDSLFGGGGGRDVLAGLGADDVLGDSDGARYGGTAIDADVLDGGAGNDVVSYGRRAVVVHVDLRDTMPDGQAGEGDRLVSIEGVFGGSGADRLTGTADGNTLHGGPGRDVIDAGAGADTVGGGSGVDRIRAGAGDDVVSGGRGEDSISLGSGDDVIDDDDDEDGDRAAAGGDRITCGSGRDRIKARELRRVDRLARDCELFTAVENRADELVADDDAVTAQLRGLRRSGTAVLVTVKCVRPKGSRACVVGARLRMPGSNRALARTLGYVRVKPGRQTTLRLRLSAAGQRRVRRGRQVRLLLAERTRGWDSFLLYRAEAQTQVVVR